MSRLPKRAAAGASPLSDAHPAKWSLAVGVASLALASCLIAGCNGDGGDSGQVQPAADLKADATNVRSLLGSREDTEVKLSRCPVRTGGYGVKIAGISCKKVRANLTRLVNLSPETHLYRPNDPRVADWTCWSRLLHRRLIQFVCWNGGQIILFKFA
jgi:hypothetical protein